MKKKKYLSLLLAAIVLLAVCGTATAYASALGAGGLRGGAPAGAAFTEDGSLLVCDTWNKVVWKVSGGSAALYAGVIGAPGITGEPVGAYHDDAAENACFLEPWAVVPSPDRARRERPTAMPQTRRSVIPPGSLRTGTANSTLRTPETV